MVLRRVCALCFFCISLGACSATLAMLQGAQGAAATADKSYEPIARGTFVLPPDGDNVVGTLQAAVTRREDTLLDIARYFGLGYNEITGANPGVDPWLPGDGTRILLPTQFVLPDAPRKGIVINLATRRLFYYPKSKKGEPRVVVTHPIGVGRVDWSTPTGRTRIVGKQTNPPWYVPASIRKEHADKGDPLPKVVPPGPDNPLGQFAMRLGMRQYLIHGTNKPYGIGMRVSHGCIRLYPEDIETLFKRVPVGTPVKLVNQSYLAGRRGPTLYLEAHVLPEEFKAASDNDFTPAIQALIRADGDQSGAIDWDRAARVALDAGGFPIPVSTDSPTLSALIDGAAVREIPFPPGTQQADSKELDDLFFEAMTP